ncbi:MAG: hypothetical protein ACXVY5_00185 [Gaiellales bacterium]
MKDPITSQEGSVNEDWNGGLEDMLRSATPQPRDEFVRGVTGRVGRSSAGRRAQRATWTLGVTVLAAVSLASFGGVANAWQSVKYVTYHSSPPTHSEYCDPDSNGDTHSYNHHGHGRG